jgi:thiol:disulfide interchange protein
MRKQAVLILGAIVVFTGTESLYAETANAASSGPAELARYEKEFSSARLEPARIGEQRGIAVIFEGSDDLHYYAREETAAAKGFELKVSAKSDDFEFGKAVFPKWTFFQDPAVGRVEVYIGGFTAFVPIKAVKGSKDTGDVEVTISGQACTSKICLIPLVNTTLRVTVDYSKSDSWKQISLESKGAVSEGAAGPSYPIWYALGLAFLAGLLLNIMPCVWPVLPLIVMRIVEQAKRGKRRSMVMGLAFCMGILLFFFAVLVVPNIILQVFYGTVMQWGDPFRSPFFVGFLALLLVVLALFMFGVFGITVPSSVASRSGSGKGYAGAAGMGFLAALLSTPCSFGILGAAFAWALGQNLALGTLAITLIGVGMATPYAILTSMPGLLKRLPKGGQWMELFKQAVGFVLLGIAIWLVSVLPQQRRADVLYFALALSFCVWMWGGWVSYNTIRWRKVLIRSIAVALALFAGRIFLVPPVPSAVPIDWQPYDAGIIETARTDGRPVLIKFTADWCLSCKVVERAVYAREEISKLVREKNVLAIKGDTTGTGEDYPATSGLKNVYKEPGIPLSVFFLPGQEQPLRWRSKSFVDELKEALEKLPSVSTNDGRESESEKTSGG